MMFRHLILFLTLLNSLSLYGTTFRAILIADTASNLKLSAQRDLGSLKAALQKICSKTGHELVLDVLDGYLVCYHNVSSVLTAPTNNDADILLFYYTGHGFHPPKLPSPWPAILLSLTHEALNAEHIYNHLSSYHARLTIALFDCCNSLIPEEAKSPLVSKGLGLPPLKQEDYIRKLFMETSGTIIATASSPGHPAFAFRRGSLFTSSLLKSLFVVDSWPLLFDQVAAQCRPRQEPIVLLDLTQLAVPSNPKSAKAKSAS